MIQARVMRLRAAEYVEVDHPWVSNALMPIYRCIFPSEATGEELRAYLRARDEWAIRVRYHFAWVFDLSKVTNAPATQREGATRAHGLHPEILSGRGGIRTPDLCLRRPIGDRVLPAFSAVS
jgi:hypothetical protein